MRTKILPGEHVMIAGMTGSGKTYLAKAYLANSPAVVVLDTKRTFDFRLAGKDLVGRDDYTVVEHLAKIDKLKTRIIVYRPVWTEQTKEYFDSFFEWCFKRRNTIVYVDEMMGVAPGGRQEAMPAWGRAIYTQGRERGVSMWASTQRPANIPLMCLSESLHWFVFSLSVEQDRQRIYNNSGQPEFLKKTEWHNFLYWKTNGSAPPRKARLILPK